jgi:hypothetical protein
MNHVDQSTDDVDRIDELNRAWDAWNDKASNQGSLGGDLQQLFADLESADDAPEPDPRFLASLRADLVTPVPIPSVVPIRRTSLGIVARPSLVAPFPCVTPIRIALAAVAAVLLVAALVGGNRWLPGSGSAVMVASAMASPASRDEPTATTYPRTSYDSGQSDGTSHGKASASLVTYPTAIPISPENTTFGVADLQVVRTPAIVYSIQ